MSEQGGGTTLRETTSEGRVRKKRKTRKKTPFTYFIRRNAIAVASKLGFEEESSGVFREILGNEDASDGRYIHHEHISYFNFFSEMLEGPISYSEIVRMTKLVSKDLAPDRTHLSRGVDRDRLSVISTQIGLICLQTLMDLMDETHGFSIALYGCRWKGRKHMGLLLRFYVREELQSFFLGHFHISDALDDKAATHHVFDNIAELLDLMCSKWKDRIVGVATDGARDMLAIYNGIQKRFRDVATHKLICVWCGYHQLDVEVSDRYSDKRFKVDEEMWTYILDTFVTLLRKHNTYFGSQCPPRATTGWYM